MFLNDMGLLMFLAVTASILGHCQTDEKVSFYGASYIRLRVQEAKGATDISFRFRTHLSDAMLLLAAGKTDYCLIKLEAGRLKVHINLGAGESEMASARGLTLNDLSWHEVNLTRREANITLQIDVIHTTRSLLPGRFFELNIHYGVYIGGQGNFNELFLGHTDYLRGCMADIIYNGARVIEYARSRRGQSEVTAVTWGCSPEFDATWSTEVSFVEDGAFTAIPRAIPRSGSRWEFDMKTGNESGLLLYNTGQSSYADYLGIELFEGKIRLLMNKGNGPTELIHANVVSDGKWHRIVVDFSPSSIGIAVDRQEKTIALPSGGNRYLDLADTLYIGGTELNKRARALGKGLRSGDASYKGCLRNMMLDNKELGLPDVKVSQGIVVGCVWGFPCFEADPCVSDALCEQLGVNSFKCTCDQPLCIKPNFAEDYKVYSNANLPVNLEILSLSPLSVTEGERVLVTSENIGMVLDIANYDVDEDGVLFNLVTPPTYGTLALDLPNSRTDRSFTLQDINRDKIQYMHDGSETTEDSMILELTLVPGREGFTLPGYLRGRLRFPLHVNVTPVNDPPLLEIPTAKVLRLAQGTRKTLTKELIWAIDADTPSETLVYTVLRTDTDAGHIERITYPSKPIDTFTQAELMQGLIAYVHRGNAKSNAMLGLQVNDGIESSHPAYLRVSAYQLQIKLLHNTGLVVVHRSFSYLTPANLSFITNSDDDTIEIRYDISTAPQYGTLQTLKDVSSSWQNADHFTSHDVNSHMIRYLHNIGSPAQDEFKFQASVRDIKTQQIYDFRITFIDLELKEIAKVAVNFTNTAEVILTGQNVKYQTNPLITSPNKILFTLNTGPRYGELLVTRRKINPGDSFTQEDIDTGKVRYRLYRRAYSIIQDELAFRVSAPQCIDILSTLSLKHHLAKNSKAVEGTETLKIGEGSKVALKMLRTNTMDYGISSLIYNLTINPRHGLLVVQNRTKSLIRSNAVYFTSEELLSQSVYYIHDDSETNEDSFEYIGLALDSVDFMYVGRFRIEVIMKNDNPPERTVHKTFHVVSKGEKLITNKDLAYIDKDINTKPSDIKYTRKDNGKSGIYRITDPSVQIREFTQKNIDDEKILFRHYGDDCEKIEYTVSDGYFHTDGVLQIEASPPYIRLKESNGSIVQFNKSVVFQSKELEIETNVYMLEKEVKYTIWDRPKYGILLKHAKETNAFTGEDLIHSSISYRHLGSSLNKDNFKFRISAKGAETEGIFTIKVYPASYWEAMTVLNNKTIFVEESTSLLINRKSLEIMHPKISSSEIIYFLRDWPQNGYLEIQSHDEHTEESKEEYVGNWVKQFDQALINDGRLFYVQSVMNQTNDKFVVDVTNGIMWMYGLNVNFIIVPDKLYVESKNLNVIEGKSVILDETDFIVITSYYAGKVTDYRIIDKPKHGVVIDSTRNSQVKKFPQKHLTGGMILYKHNGDEFSKDSFKMLAIAGDKISEPFDVWIVVQPINDEIPVLVNKTKLNVWQGGSIILMPSYLAAVDNDTVPREITFNVTAMKNGYISMLGSGVEIYNFTQQQIDESKIVFTHSNGSEAEFSFVLNDGIHMTEAYNISIVAKPVRLNVEQNIPLNVFPLTRKVISNKLLLIRCSDKAREIKYIVRNGPHLGKIIMETGEGVWLEVDRFTQKDINESKVFYEHRIQFMDLAANDSFTFDIEAHYTGSITNQVFHIDISVSSGGLDRYVAAKTVRVAEGSYAEVIMNISGIISFLQTNAGIDKPAVLSRLVNQPSHGHVMLLPDLNVTTFTQPQIEGGKIAYYHDHSDTLEDRIFFSLYLTPGHVLLCNTSISVIIQPINDEPFKLITNAPYITVVQNQNQTITRDNLLTIDPDTPAEEIIYDVISGPTFGRLLLLPFDQNSSEVKQVNKFSQLDVDSNRLVYEHNGPLQAASFYFRVWDGRFNPTYTVFNVHVLAIRLNVTVPSPVKLQQGSNVASISEENVKLDTNARQDLVSYEVTNNPKHGVLYVRDAAATNFKQTDLLSKSVMFLQTDMTVSNDSLELSARLSGFEQQHIRVKIRVVPLMIMNPMMALMGEKNQITLQHMDATPLAKLTSSNPVYTIIKKPKYSKIKRIIRSSSTSGEKRGTREREIGRFTHQEIVSGVIYLVCKKIPTMEYEGLSDSFAFVLAASIFQPATGEFDIRVKFDMDDYNSTLAGPMDPIGHEGEMAIAPNMSNDYLLILGMLLGAFLLSIVVIITIRCRHNRYKRTEEDKPETTPSVGVMPLPRPPDHLMPTTPHLKRFANEHGTLTSSTPLPVLPSMTSTLPQCKVIPLNPLESITGSEVDVSARYPYGVADGDEWSSFDTSDLPCQSATTQRTNNPLLRRNQYWV